MPLVSVIMGSISDLDTVKPCFETLDKLGIAYEGRVISAHRAPAVLAEYVEEAPERGIQVFIAAAGGAAHLAGGVAAHTTLPVIGIPIPAGALQGFDALFATVQMPPGVPVATVSVGSWGAVNAAVFACQILALGNAVLGVKLKDYKAAQVVKVARMDDELQKVVASFDR